VIGGVVSNATTTSRSGSAMFIKTVTGSASGAASGEADGAAG
jgi:hypothetical protein